MRVVSLPLANRRLYDKRVFLCSTIPLIEPRTERPLSPSRTARRHRQFHAPLPIRLWHLASLDAPTVALIWSLSFAWVTDVRLPWWVLFLVPLGVWAVYVVDRLLDARRGVQLSALEQLRERHIFHWRHRRILVPIAAVSTLIAAWIVFRLMPSTTREHDSLLAAASFLYFTRVHSGHRFLPLLPKELLVGAIFTLGCVIPVFSRAHLSVASWPILIAAVFFALLAWLNCHAIDRWESRDANSSGYLVALPALILTAACSICFALLFASHPRSACLIACGAAAALLLAALDRVRGRITPVTLRATADLALLTPAMLLALAPLFCK